LHLVVFGVYTATRMANWQRRLRGKHSPILVRTLVPVTYTREQAVGMTAFCRKYGLLDAQGSPRGVEAVRFLVVLGLTPGADRRARAAIAARINLKSMVAAIGSRLTMGVGGKFPDEPTMVVKQRIGIRIDSWLRGQLSYFAKFYRDGNGGVDDIKLMYDFTTKGMADPDLDAVASIYAKMMNPMRVRMAQLETAIQDSLHKIQSEWAVSMGSEMPESLDGGQR